MPLLNEGTKEERTGGEALAVLLPIDGGRRVGADDAAHFVRLAVDGRLFGGRVLPRDSHCKQTNKQTNKPTPKNSFQNQ